MKCKFLFLLIYLCLISPVQSYAALVPLDISAGAPKVNLRELVQECPIFANYPGYNGVIWQKNSYYESDGAGISITKIFVILGRTGLDKKWLEWELEVPKVGRLEVFQSKLYDPGSLSEIQNAVPVKTPRTYKINFSPNQEEFIIVLTYKQTFPGQLLLRDFLQLSDELPIWEQTITAKPDKSEDFVFRTNTGVEPSESTDEKHDIYSWLFVNQTPSGARSLRADTMPWLVFGSGKRGYEGLLPDSNISEGKPSSNKMSVNLNLELDENLTMTGSVNITTRGEWEKFFLNIPEPRKIFVEIFGSDKIFAGRFETKKTKNGTELSATLKPNKVILSTLGGNAIVPLPLMQPAWLAELGKAALPYSVIFPMTIEANYRLNVKTRIQNVFLPANVDVGFGDIKYSEKYSRRNNRIDLAVEFSIKRVKLDKDLERDLRVAVTRWAEQKNIPIRVK